ncbi:MAG TPA: DUF4199 domain-containing protein [Williamwhitmania sp.]|jgi:hypothetical protein|nr:DUF4199 domain-containing protein [Williamwhitmania sp.]
MDNTTKPTSIFQPAMTYGLILALGIILYSIVIYVLNIYTPGMGIQAIQWVIIFGLIYYGQIKYRDDYKNGVLSYSQSLGFGVLIGLFASLIYALYFVVLVKMIDPGYIEKLLQAMEQKMYEANKISDEQIQTVMNMYKQKMTVGTMVLASVFMMTLISFVVSLITSIFAKKVESPFSSDEMNG